MNLIQSVKKEPGRFDLELRPYKKLKMRWALPQDFKRKVKAFSILVKK